MSACLVAVARRDEARLKRHENDAVPYAHGYPAPQRVYGE
jgi:hypothetical protein